MAFEVDSFFLYCSQGKEAEVVVEEEPRIRSPLTEKISIPKSPIRYKSNGLISPVLPPLKFHSGLLAPRSHTFVASSGFNDGESDESVVDSVLDGDDDESFSDDDEEVFGSNNFEPVGFRF